MLKKCIFIFIFSFVTQQIAAQKIALLKYNGGGDWYANPTALPNLIDFCNKNIATRLDQKPVTVNPGGPEIFMYPFVHMTGHGNVIFSESEAENLRNYLLGGGFLHIDDNYGMREYLISALKKVFPEKELQELPASHPIFHSEFEFSQGLPKIHEHDAKRPQAFGIFDEGRLVLLFTFESDLGDGWENEEVHHDPAEVRLKALKMGANIIKYAFEN
ncbi:DUF4159 domain-containing protein [Zunongwangia atlantica]|uniref:DUF4159 domain-containing protein n=1 Tax=Zunongwangia atlantica 22II14-10F7 TaxID=1185767 RepID=A0A1Y1T776_9FLAO|nr:DUF4159 domain-containing protein [Zunongwangia atlantica]ORL46434.1 hypothetical protein IIF7_05302 [Zunongwangia atlantica 22II14-10F7]